jgi:Protein of unknown function (DUF3306)
MLSRWSRLKSAANKLEVPGSKLPEPPAPIIAEEVIEPASGNVNDSQEAIKAELPKIADLTPDSDFTPFMQSGVDAVDRNAALKKLFTDPHYNQMDGLDIYIDDYGKADPIPDAMLKRLMASKFLGLFEEEEPKEVAQRVEPAHAVDAENQTLELSETPRENPSSSLSDDIQLVDAPKERDFLDK